MNSVKKLQDQKQAELKHHRAVAALAEEEYQFALKSHAGCAKALTVLGDPKQQDVHAAAKTLLDSYLVTDPTLSGLRRKKLAAAYNETMAVREVLRVGGKLTQ